MNKQLENVARGHDKEQSCSSSQLHLGNRLDIPEAVAGPRIRCEQKKVIVLNTRTNFLLMDCSIQLLISR